MALWPHLANQIALLFYRVQCGCTGRLRIGAVGKNFCSSDRANQCLRNPIATVGLLRSDGLIDFTFGVVTTEQGFAQRAGVHIRAEIIVAGAIDFLTVVKPVHVCTGSLKPCSEGSVPTSQSSCCK